MAYNRTYSLQDVVRILNESEHRLRPDITSGSGPKGHAISMHTLERKNMMAREGHLKEPVKDSIFLVDRNSLATMVHEALNSPTGQRELARLNEPDTKYVTIESVVLRQGKNFDIFTVYRPKPKGEQSYFDWLSVTKGDGYIVQVFVLVYRIPNSREDDIHIQTAFAKDFARTQGDAII